MECGWNPLFFTLKRFQGFTNKLLFTHEIRQFVIYSHAEWF